MAARRASPYKLPSHKASGLQFHWQLGQHRSSPWPHPMASNAASLKPPFHTSTTLQTSPSSKRPKRGQPPFQSAILLPSILAPGHFMGPAQQPPYLFRGKRDDHENQALLPLRRKPYHGSLPKSRKGMGSHPPSRRPVSAEALRLTPTKPG